MKSFLLKNLAPLLLTVFVLAIFWPTLQSGFVYWDDDTHLFQNPLVTTPGLPDVKKIFTPAPPAGFIPLVTMSFAMERYFFGMDPFHFHLINIVLHAAVIGEKDIRIMFYGVIP
jgi:hypothetical protein